MNFIFYNVACLCKIYIKFWVDQLISVVIRRKDSMKQIILVKEIRRANTTKIINLLLSAFK